MPGSHGRLRLALAAAAAVCAWGSPNVRGAEPEAKVEAVVVGAKVFTLDAENRCVEALAIGGGRILAVGGEREVRRAAGPDAELLDLTGAFVYPGFIDAHCHLASLGRLRSGMLDLNDTKSYDEMLGRVKARLEKARPGAWVVGRGWDQADWGRRELPD
ncbi:MAG: amidohydrolase family protein, partial [Planctomycetota bacterium]